MTKTNITRQLFIGLLFIACTSKTDKIDTIALVFNANQNFETFIFFEQDTTFGNVQKQQQKQLFLIENKVQLFFVRQGIGNGNIQFYEVKNNKTTIVDYSYPMGPKDWKSNDFQITGSGLRGVFNYSRKKEVPYIAFKSGTVRNLESKGWDFSAERAIQLYKTIIKNDSLTSESQEPNSSEPIIPLSKSMEESLK